MLLVVFFSPLMDVRSENDPDSAPAELSIVSICLSVLLV